MKRIFFIIIIIINISVCDAQVLINLHLPQAGLNIKRQLWNLSLVNTGQQNAEARIELLISDASNGQAILSASSRLFTLMPGNMQIQSGTVDPIVYNVLNSSYNIDNNPEGFLPIGVYTICFSVIKRTTDYFEKVSEECTSIEVEPASPPFLNTPEDAAEITEDRPLFTWVPPSPVFLFSNLNYKMKLVEVGKNQSAADAVQNNFPVLNQSSITAPSFQFPFSLRALDTGKLYAWQVKALNNDKEIANSEVFSFTLARPADAAAPQAEIYVKLSESTDMPFSVCTGIFKYEYVNKNNSPVLQLKLTDLTSKTNVRIPLDNDLQEVRYGQNFLKLDLRNNSAVRNNRLYQLSVQPAGEPEQSAKFIYKKAD